MEQSGLSAVATYVHHDREHLGCLRIRDGVITLERMFFADEIRAPEGIAPAAAKVDKRQLAMANDLIKAYTGDFDPTQYTDTYRERLLAVIEAKRSGTDGDRQGGRQDDRPTRPDGGADRIARPGARCPRRPVEARQTGSQAA